MIDNFSGVRLGKLKCNSSLNVLSTFHIPPLRLPTVLTVTDDFSSNEAEIPISKIGVTENNWTQSITLEINRENQGESKIWKKIDC